MDHDWSPVRELSFLKGLQTARPIGIHKHFHMIQVIDLMEKEGRGLSSREGWERLESYYDTGSLDRLVSGRSTGQGRTLTEISRTTTFLD